MKNKKGLSYFLIFGIVLAIIIILAVLFTSKFMVNKEVQDAKNMVKIQAICRSIDVQAVSCVKTEDKVSATFVRGSGDPSLEINQTLFVFELNDGTTKQIILDGSAGKEIGAYNIKTFDIGEVINVSINEKNVNKVFPTIIGKYSGGEFMCALSWNEIECI